MFEIAADLFRAAALSVHLLAGALAGAGPLVTGLLRLLLPVSVESDAKLRSLLSASVFSMVLSAIVGGATGCVFFAGYEAGYRDAVLRVPLGSYAMLAAEWLFSLVLLILYLAVWRRMANRRALHGLIAFVAATNTLYHFPTMMIVIGELAQRPDLTPETEVTRSVFRQLIVRPELMAKTAHFWALSLLAAGVAGSWIAVQGHRPAPVVARACGVIALVGLALLLASGLATLLLLNPAQQGAMTGGQGLASVAFGGALIAALSLGYMLMPLAAGEADLARVRSTALLTFAATFLMALASLRASTG